MRYVMLFITGVICLIFTGAVFPNLNIYGIAPDIIICCITSIAVLDKTMAGAGLGLVCGLMLDLIFTGAIGAFALPYMIVGAALYFAVRPMRYINAVLTPAALTVGAYLIKELISTVIIYTMNIQFSFGHMLVRYILPEALATGILMLLVHLIFRRIYRSSAVKPHDDREFKKL